MPTDEAPRDPSLVAFRTHLLQAAEHRDTVALLGVLDPTVRSSFGGDVGIEDFKAFWKLDEPNSRVWAVLRDVLSHGGGFMQDGQFCAPYTFAKWPQGAELYDGALIAQDVPIYSRRDSDSPVLTRRSYEVVSILGAEAEPTWYMVLTHDGVEGFVEARSLRSGADWRACCHKTASGWRLTALIAGD
jgi:hypothetical protein